MHESAHVLTLNRYRLEELSALSDKQRQLALSTEVRDAILAGARFVRELATRDEHVYGVNTGFGALCEVRVGPDDVRQLQYNHLVSHAAGIGPPASQRVSRLTMLIKLLTLRSGRTGIGLALVERLIDMWNAAVVSVIPRKGTVGASGDLAPLAHMSLPLLGLGEVWLEGQRYPSEVLCQRFGWDAIELQAKEGLALTNGVQYINAHAVDSLIRFRALADFADIIASLSAQAFSASNTFAHSLYHTTTLHRDRQVVAANIRWATAGGNHHALPTANRSKQDPYSFRCMPQVHGAVRQLLAFCWQLVEDEVNGVSDNPLFFAEHQMALYGGNLHGQSTAFALDILAMAASELASISERRTYQLHAGRRGLPDFLVKKVGLNSGLMIAQYSAAALVNESKTLCHPASVDTIPTCQLQEDHVSMGGTSALKLETIIDNCEYVLAIELLSAVQAAELLPGLQLSEVGMELQQSFRRVVLTLEQDRILQGDIEAARNFVATNAPSWSERLRTSAPAKDPEHAPS
jgi:histidine ammonia-lyase